jgi:RNA polymerase sigma-70 factor (ECF subfamily)
MTVPAGAIVEEALPIARVAEDALGTLVREHARLVYRVCYSVLRHAEDSEDAAQETFMRVMRNLKKLPEVRDPRAWLARIAWRVALDRKRASPEMSLEDAAAAGAAVAALRDSGASADELAAGNEMSALLERLIGSLPEELRAPLVLSTVEEMTAADIAAVLEIPEASVRTRIFRARQLLREKLDGILERKS